MLPGKGAHGQTLSKHPVHLSPAISWEFRDHLFPSLREVTRDGLDSAQLRGEKNRENLTMFLDKPTTTELALLNNAGNFKTNL